MNLKEIKISARERMKGFCSLCKECNGVACQGQVPGMGGLNSAESFKRNYESLKNVRIVMSALHDVKEPDTSWELWGKKFELPFITAPVTGNAINMGGYLTEDQYCDVVVEGSLMAGSMAMIGDSGNPSFYEAGLHSISKKEGNGIAIVKPRENEKIIENIKRAEKVNSFAVGMDIDGAGLITMNLMGQPVSPKTKDELKEVIESTDLPFIVKGIMSVKDAIMAKEAGAKAIIVSNHGGRVLDYCLGSADVLPSIARELKGELTILVDGNVRHGSDIFKYIALGADAVLAARPIIWGAYGNGRDGVKTVIQDLKNSLYQTMILTGAKTLKDITEDKIVNLNIIK